LNRKKSDIVSGSSMRKRSILQYHVAPHFFIKMDTILGKIKKTGQIFWPDLFFSHVKLERGSLKGLIEKGSDTRFAGSRNNAPNFSTVFDHYDRRAARDLPAGNNRFIFVFIPVHVNERNGLCVF